MNIMRWLTSPIHIIQQLRYLKGLMHQRHREHNAKYQAMKAMWHTNGVAMKCEACVTAMLELDIEANPDSALASIESLLKRLQFESAPQLMTALDRLVEETIEFYPNPVLREIASRYPELAEECLELADRSIRDVELQLEGEAKTVLKALSGHVDDMVRVYQGLMRYLPPLRKTLKPGMLAGVFKVLGWAAESASQRGSDNANNVIVSWAFEIGGAIVKQQLEALEQSLAEQKTDDALGQFNHLVESFEHACSTFAATSEQNFDPILRKFMAHEKAREDEILSYLKRVSSSRFALKPVYNSLYGKLRD